MYCTGLDQTLNWIGEPSKSRITRLKHKDLSEFNYTIGMSYISEEDYHDGRYIYFIKVIGETKKKSKHVDTVCGTTYNIDRRHENVEMG